MSEQFRDERCGACEHDSHKHTAGTGSCWECPVERRCQRFVQRDAREDGERPSKGEEARNMYEHSFPVGTGRWLKWDLLSDDMRRWFWAAFCFARDIGRAEGAESYLDLLRRHGDVLAAALNTIPTAYGGRWRVKEAQGALDLLLAKAKESR